MLKRRFVWKDHSDFGPGWCPAWMENGDPVQGFGAAHDTLEHFPRCIGGFEGEMMAFGAMHMIRGGSDWNNASNIYEAQSSDLHLFLQAVISGDQTLRDPGKFTLDGLDYTDPEECLRWIRHGIVGACKEMSGNPESASEVASYRRALPRDADQRILGWMIHGAKKAQKRFAQWDLPGWRLNEMFDDILLKFDRAARNGGEGECIDVRVNFVELAVTVTRCYEYE